MKCAIYGCRGQVRDWQSLCSMHWARLPENIRAQIQNARIPSQREEALALARRVFDRQTEADQVRYKRTLEFYKQIGGKKDE